MRGTLFGTFGTAVFLFLAIPASAQTAAAVGEGANPIRRPTVIDKPGVYVVERDIVLGDQEVAIAIQASGVTLDLGGHTLIGPGGKRGRGIAVIDASNVRVFGGNLRRFGIGVFAQNVTNLRVEDLQIDGLDLGGAPPDIEIGVLLVDSRGSRVEHNVITDTFLGIFVRGEESGGNRISDNLITGANQGELGICYNPAPGQSAGGPHGDLVYQNVVSRFRRAISLSADSTGNVLRENTLAYFDLAIQEATPGANVIADNDEVQIQK